jgi:hypothetical protein
MTAAGAAAQVGDLGVSYVAGARADIRERCRAVTQFQLQFGTVEQWRRTSIADRLAASPPARAFAAFRRCRRRHRCGRHLCGLCRIEVGPPCRRPGPRAGFPVSAPGGQSGLRPARGRQDVVQAGPDQCDGRHHAGDADQRAVPVGAGSVPSRCDRQARTSAEVADHAAVRARCSDVPPRQAPRPSTTAPWRGAFSA